MKKCFHSKKNLILAAIPFYVKSTIHCDCKAGPLSQRFAKNIMEQEVPSHKHREILCNTIIIDVSVVL